jgi:hypothetical protein
LLQVASLETFGYTLVYMMGMQVTHFTVGTAYDKFFHVEFDLEASIPQ